MKNILKRLATTSGLLIFFFIIVGTSAYLTSTLLIKSEDTVILPDLTGKDGMYALELLSNMGLNTKIKGSEYSADTPKNHIIFQDPEPGEEIKKGRDVRIIISKGEKNILMPNLKGRPLQQARIIMDENDLRLGAISATYNERFKKDNIIAQYPSPGAMISRERQADFLVSMGCRPDAYKMPDLAGMSIEDAIMIIEKNNFLVGEIKAEFHHNKPKNTVESQVPPAGHRVVQGSLVHLVLNKKPGKKSFSILRRANGIRLFRYRLNEGFIKRRIKARLNCFGLSSVIFDDLLKPDEEIWVLIPNNQDATLSLYEDGELKKTMLFDSW